MSRIGAAAALLMVWLGLCCAAWAGNPDLKWRTLETEHFFVHYFAGEDDAAERTAAVAERAYDELTVLWGHRVFLKTHITLRDSTDTANGRASAVPFPNITANATAPGSLSVLESYDDWIDILITHELVHVVHLDTVHGLYRLINAVFGFGVLGKVTSPNVLQPRWIVEGVATHNESSLSAQGRRRSAQFDAIIRTAVLEGQFQTLDQVSSGARIYPHGTSVYLYGVHFMYYIAARYGDDKLKELSHIYATQLIPFGINKAIKKVLGVSFYRLWADFKRDTVRRFQAEARRIRSRGLRQGRRLTFSGEVTRYPMWAPDDAYIYFYKNDGHREEGLKRISARGGRIREGRGIGRQGADVDVEHVIDIEDPSAASFVGATGDVVFDMVRTHDFRYSWSDLYRYNGGDPKQAEQLTFGLRASEPHVSADGRTAVFRRNDIAQARLAFLDLASGDVVEVRPMGRIAQVYSPRFAPDGHRVAFSGFREGGYRDLYLYDRDTGKTTRLTANRHMDMSPTWTPDGRYILFTSDRDGVMNIYAYDTQRHALHQVSNVLGGAFQPSVSNDGTRIAYVGFNKSGFDLWLMEFDPDRWLSVASSVAPLPMVDDGKPELEGQDGRPLEAQAKRYQPIKTMFPRTFTTGLIDFQTGMFGQSLGFGTSVTDILGFHFLSGTFEYLLDERLASGSLVYSFRRLFPDFTVLFARDIRRPRGFDRFVYDRPEGGDSDTYLASGYRERATTIDASMSLPAVRHSKHSADVSVGYRWVRWTNLDDDENLVDPNAPATSLPEVGDDTVVTLGARYSSLSDGRGRFTYGAETGRSAAVALTIDDQRLGGDFQDLRASASYQEVIPMPWRGHQSLQLVVRGGASAGGLARRGGFGVGSYPQGQEVIQNLLGRTGFGTGNNALIRGYEPQAQRGRFFASGTAAYRIPLLDIDRGIGTLPFFFQRVGLIPFVDWGAAWTEPLPVQDTLVGAGGALVLSFRLGHVETVHLFLHYAHGFDSDLGLDVFRLIVATSF